ncbi:MAG: cell wall-binding repeat-containing protein [Acidimicrobiales bacterium]
MSARSRHKVAGAVSALAVATGSLTMLAAGTAGAQAPTTSTGAQVTHVSGADRIATSIAASQAAYPKAGSAKAVVVANDSSFSDALAGGPLASAVGGPLLLSSSGQIPQAVLDEIIRVLPPGSPVYVLGGTSALSSAVSDAITHAGFTVQHLAGSNRFATAVDIAKVINPSMILEATGMNFPDALSAGPAAALHHAAILLTDGATQAPETAAYLAAHPTDVLYAIGGPAATADPSAIPVVGTDRFGTATMVASTFFNAVKSIGLASGADFPDALSAVPLLAQQGAPMLLTNPTGSLPTALASWLSVNKSVLSGLTAFGGTSALSSGVLSEVTGILSSLTSSI